VGHVGFVLIIIDVKQIKSYIIIAFHLWGCTPQAAYNIGFSFFSPDESDSIAPRRIYIVLQLLVNKTYCNFSRNSEQRIVIAGRSDAHY
jgi:hypothetical protein